MGYYECQLSLFEIKLGAISQKGNRLTNSRASRRPCLIVVDVQIGFRDEEFWGRAANPGVYRELSALLDEFSKRDWPVAVIRHDSVNPESPLHPSSPGNSLESLLEGHGDVLVSKHVNSAFYGDPDLDAWCKQKGITEVVIAGITTNYCCETTARMASNLGYKTHFVVNATSTFDSQDIDGALLSGRELMRITAANLGNEFATVHRDAKGFIDSLTGL